MCNYLHKDSKPIKKSGVGYKIFETRTWSNCAFTRKQLFSTIYKLSYHHSDGKVKWDSLKNGDGFCFFLSKQSAEKANKSWKKGSKISRKTVVVKILYSNGLAKHREDCFVDGRPTIALCKEFSIDPKSKWHV